MFNAFCTRCLSFYVELCLQIKNRFRNLSKYENFKLINPQLLRDKPVSLTPLIEQFPNLINNNIDEEISSEEREISCLPADIKNKLKQVDFTEFWFELNS